MRAWDLSSTPTYQSSDSWSVLGFVLLASLLLWIMLLLCQHSDIPTETGVTGSPIQSLQIWPPCRDVADSWRFCIYFWITDLVFFSDSRSQDPGVIYIKAVLCVLRRQQDPAIGILVDLVEIRLSHHCQRFIVNSQLLSTYVMYRARHVLHLFL